MTHPPKRLALLVSSLFFVATVGSVLGQAPTSGQVVAAPILDVPFISQRENACGSGCIGMNNCGPASLAMVLKAYGCQPPGMKDLDFVHKLREVIDKPNICDQKGTSFQQAMMGLPKMKDPGLVDCSALPLQQVSIRPATASQDVQSILDRVATGNPAIVAVSATLLEPLQTTTTAFAKKDGSIDDRHILVVTGSDQDRVYVNDPLYYWGVCSADQGAWYYTRSSFEQAVTANGGGALFIGDGPPRRLSIVQSLTVGAQVRPGETQVARFRVRNVSSITLTLPKIGVSGRGPQESNGKPENLGPWKMWQAPRADWPLADNVELAPGQEYEYVQSRTFSQEGTYFAALSYWDSTGTWHTLTGPAVFQVSASAVSQDDAALVGSAPSPRVSPNSETTVAITLRNTGSSVWAPGQGYALRNVGGLAPSSAGEVPVGSTVAVAGTFQAVMRLRAPGGVGVYTSEWQMVHGDQPFGPRVTVQVRVEGTGPGGPANWWDRLMESIRRQIEVLQDSVRRQVEAWQRQIDAYFDEQMARLRREVEQGIQREIERQLRGLCAGGLLVPGLLLGASMWLRQWGSGHRRDP